MFSLAYIMSTQLDDLDDEEIEASLLWTDDEDGDHENIDPLDEEMLLSEPTSLEPTLKKDDTWKTFENVINSANSEKDTFQISKLVESKEPAAPCKISEDGISTLLNSPKLNEDIINYVENSQSSEEALETTLTDEFVDLNVTLNTRDALESSLVEDTTLFHDNTESNANVGLKIIENNGNFDSSPMLVPTVSLNESYLSKNQTEDKELASKSEDNVATQGDVGIVCAKVSKSFKSELQVQADDKQIASTLKSFEPDNSVLSVLGGELSESKAEDESHLTVIDSLEESADQSKTDNFNAASANSSENLNDTKHDEPLGSCSFIDAVPPKRASSIDNIKSNHQAVSKTKRTPSLSDEQEPALKRFRQSSEPLTVGSEINNKERKPVENNKSSNPSILSPDTPESVVKKGIGEVNKKKSIVTFDFQYYCKEPSTNPYVCKTCSMKFKEELKFESHLIATHAMALNISHFNIDLNQYYRQKKEKIIAQSKTVLPKLEGIVDEALIKDYNQNVKLITAQKNLQYFCKMCENIYSTKNLIIEHLKSPKHILRKQV